MEEKNDRSQAVNPAAFHGNAVLDSVEFQRNWALTEWARCRADLAVAAQVIAEQGGEIAKLNARITQLEGEPHGRSD